MVAFNVAPSVWSAASSSLSAYLPTSVAPSALAEAGLWSAIFCGCALIAGTVMNVRDGWTRPHLRYRLAFLWSLCLTAATFLVALLFASRD